MTKPMWYHVEYVIRDDDGNIVDYVNEEQYFMSMSDVDRYIENLRKEGYTDISFFRVG